jgi:hypothetical protein
MKLTIAVLCAGVLGLSACDEIAEDPDIQEARTAIKGAIKDEGAALKEVRKEAEARREREAREKAD